MQSAQTKMWLLDKHKAASATLSAPQMSFVVEGREKWPWDNNLSHPQNIFCNN